MELSNLENLSKENIVFHEPKEFQLKNSSIKYKRIKIEIKYPNGKTGPLVLETEKNQDTDQLTGYSIRVCLWKKDEKPNKEEEDFYTALNKIHNICQEFLEEEYGENASSSFGEILSYKQIEYVNAKGKPKRRRMNLLLQFSSSINLFRENQKLLSLFITKGNPNINPFDYLNQYFNTKMALIVESIFLEQR